MITMPFLQSAFVLMFTCSAGLALGCPTTTGGNPATACGAVDSLSHIQGDNCVCDFTGYEFCSFPDEEDFRCCEAADDPCPENDNHLAANGGCICNEGFEWCQPADPEDLSCCRADDTGGTDTDADTDGKEPPS